jgi:hypothetical protein
MLTEVAEMKKKKKRDAIKKKGPANSKDDKAEVIPATA